MIEKLKELTLKKIGKSYMLVESDSKEVNMTNVYSMNSTAAWLWTQIDNPNCGVEEIAEAMCNEFGVELPRAIEDINTQLAQWRELGLIGKSSK